MCVHRCVCVAYIIVCVVCFVGLKSNAQIV